MLKICIKYTSGRTYEGLLHEAKLMDLLWDDFMYITIEYESGSPYFIFGKEGNVKIHENVPFLPRSVTFGRKSDLFVIPCKEDTGLYVEDSLKILGMLNIVQQNERNGLGVIRKKISRYCKKNHVNDYIDDFIMTP